MGAARPARTLNNGKLGRLSLLGGPLHRLGMRLGLVCGDANTFPLGLALGWISWLVLLALATIEGASGSLFSLSVIAGHARLLIAIPLFFLCEALLESAAQEFIDVILRSRIVPDRALPELETEIARTVRSTDSWFPDALCLLAAATPLHATQLDLFSGRTSSLEAGRALGEAPWAGLWYWIICLPLFRFLMFRWAWRIMLWWRFIWRLSQMDLHLLPTHPDGVAGLGYLEVVQMRFTPLVVALSIVVSASFAEDVSSGKETFEAIYPTLALALVADLALVLSPPCFFFCRLKACQEKGLRDYMEFAARYVTAFDKKWISGASAPEEPLLGTPDLQSLADLSTSVALVRDMRWAPISTRLIAAIIVAALAPMLPLLLLEYPLAELTQMFFKKLAGL